MKNKEKYMNLKVKEIEELFKKINSYGLGLLEGSIEALQYNYDEDASLLKEAYTNAIAVREIVDRDQEQSLPVKITILRKSLKKITDKELKFMNDLLELDPSDVFNNPYNSTNYDINSGFNKDPYYEIRSYVIDEENDRKMNKNTKKSKIKKQKIKKLTP